MGASSLSGIWVQRHSMRPPQSIALAARPLERASVSSGERRGGKKKNPRRSQRSVGNPRTLKQTLRDVNVSLRLGRTQCGRVCISDLKGHRGKCCICAKHNHAALLYYSRILLSLCYTTKCCGVSWLTNRYKKNRRVIFYNIILYHFYYFIFIAKCTWCKKRDTTPTSTN